MSCEKPRERPLHLPFLRTARPTEYAAAGRVGLSTCDQVLHLKPEQRRADADRLRPLRQRRAVS